MRATLMPAEEQGDGDGPTPCRNNESALKRDRHELLDVANRNHHM
jgi:hypothetical protein